MSKKVAQKWVHLKNDIFWHLYKKPKNDLGKFIVAKCFKKLPKAQKITQSGHTYYVSPFINIILNKYRIIVVSAHEITGHGFEPRLKRGIPSSNVQDWLATGNYSLNHYLHDMSIIMANDSRIPLPMLKMQIFVLIFIW